MNAERFYAGRSEGLVDIAWIEAVLPANDDRCPLCASECTGHDQRDPSVLALVLPVLAGWRPHMRRRDRAVVDQMIEECGR
jgi:hypothetical protein